MSLAAAAPLTWNTGLANVGYYTGYDDNTVRLVSNGAAAVFAGTANAACAQPRLPCGDGGSATNARLGVPAGLSVGVDGSLFIADSALRRLRVVAPSGVITTVAGSGAACPTTCGDGGPATAAALTAANGVAVDTHGNLYIADGSAGLRRVSPLGVISTVAAGTATGTLVSVAIGLDGTLYGAARNPDGIIAIDPGSGAVTPLVGTGTSGYNGDLDDLGGPQGGTDTQVNQPTGVSVTLDGYLAFADTGNHLVRRYNIVTQDMAEDLAGVVDDNGNPQGGTTPDGQPANATKLLSPRAVAATGTADYLITDTGNHAVRRIGPYLDDDGVGTPPPAAQKVLACRPGPTWSCRLLPAPTAAARTTVNSGVTVRRDGSTYATGPMLLAGGGGLRYLVTLERPLAPGPYTLTLRTGKHIRDLRMTLTVG